MSHKTSTFVECSCAGVAVDDGQLHGSEPLVARVQLSRIKKRGSDARTSLVPINTDPIEDECPNLVTAREHTQHKRCTHGLPERQQISQ